jgi:hypothetical protein
MTLAAILGICFFSIAQVAGFAARPQADFLNAWSASQDQSSSAGASQTPVQQTQPATPLTAPASPSKGASPSGAPASSTTLPAAKHRKRRKTNQDCSASGTAKPGSNASGSTPLPCPPPKIVVKDGGSTEPSVQLKGAADEQQQRQSTEQIAAATEDNLKKIAGRPLDTGQQQTLSQVKQFMEQSKAAIAEGDVERGHDLAMKARLLSDELIKP